MSLVPSSIHRAYPSSFSRAAFDSVILGGYITISDRPLKMTADVREGCVVQGQVINASASSEVDGLGRYVTISKVLPTGRMNDRLSVVGKIVLTDTRPGLGKARSLVVVSDILPAYDDNFPCGFMFKGMKPMNGRRDNSLKYITLCENVPASLTDLKGRVIGKVIDTDQDSGVRSAPLNNVVFAVKVPEREMPNPDLESNGSDWEDDPNLTRLLEAISQGISDGKVEVNSNSDEVRYMRNVVRSLEQSISARKSKEGHPTPK